ncbi:hypothetical protein PG994_008044 [Apiospora phragmitis]|uniref:Uncharacterized protein n=1 Tax=Apiospora phragmitis TaxID=2905665 RepID=A0ABR1URX3_9PEZI
MIPSPELRVSLLGHGPLEEPAPEDDGYSESPPTNVTQTRWNSRRSCISSRWPQNKLGKLSGREYGLRRHGGNVRRRRMRRRPLPVLPPPIPSYPTSWHGSPP